MATKRTTKKAETMAAKKAAKTVAEVKAYSCSRGKRLSQVRQRLLRQLLLRLKAATEKGD